MRQIKQLLAYVLTLALLIGGAAWAVSLLVVPADATVATREAPRERALPPRIAAWRERQAEPVRPVADSKPMREVSAARTITAPRVIVRDLAPPVRVSKVQRAQRTRSNAARRQVASGGQTAGTQTASAQQVIDMRVETLRDRTNN